MSKEQDPKRRVKFYSSKEVSRYLSVNGIPRSKGSWRGLIALSATRKGGDVSQELTDYLSDVRFEVHPEQVNVRDNANGNMVVSIRR